MTKAGLAAAKDYAASAKGAVRERLKSATLDDEQRIVHGLAWIETCVQALQAIAIWAVAHDGVGERLVVQIAFGETLAQLAGGLPMGQNEFIRPADFGLADAAQNLSTVATGNTAANRRALVEFISNGGTISAARSTPAGG